MRRLFPLAEELALFSGWALIPQASVALGELIAQHPALRVQHKNADWLDLLTLRPVGNRLYQVCCSHIHSASDAFTVASGVFTRLTPLGASYTR